MRNLLYFIPNSIHLENIFEYYKRERNHSQWLKSNITENIEKHIYIIQKITELKIYFYNVLIKGDTETRKMHVFKNKIGHFHCLLWLCSSPTLFIAVISLSGYDGGKQDTGDRVCSHRTHRSPRAAGPPVPGVPGHLPHHHGGQPWTDFSHLEGPPSSHPHVFIPGQFSLCRCLFFLFCNSQDANEFLICESHDIPGWVYLPILYFCFQCKHRVFPPGGDGLWSLCGHMQSLALPSGDV